MPESPIYADSHCRACGEVLPDELPEVCPRCGSGLRASSESRIEQLADRIIQRRLATDRAYRHAEDAVSQARREAEIEEEVLRELQHRGRPATDQ
jgi:predicted  nucleic acid-binding Zn-ribbon protein